MIMMMFRLRLVKLDSSSIPWQRPQQQTTNLAKWLLRSWIDPVQHSVGMVVMSHSTQILGRKGEVLVARNVEGPKYTASHILEKNIVRHTEMFLLELRIRRR